MVYSLGNANVYYWNKCFLHYSYALVLKAPAGQDVPDMLVQVRCALCRGAALLGSDHVLRCTCAGACV